MRVKREKYKNIYSYQKIGLMLGGGNGGVFENEQYFIRLFCS